MTDDVCHSRPSGSAASSDEQLNWLTDVQIHWYQRSVSADATTVQMRTIRQSIDCQCTHNEHSVSRLELGDTQAIRCARSTTASFIALAVGHFRSVVMSRSAPVGLCGRDDERVGQLQRAVSGAKHGRPEWRCPRRGVRRMRAVDRWRCGRVRLLSCCVGRDRRDTRQAPMRQSRVGRRGRVRSPRAVVAASWWASSPSRNAMMGGHGSIDLPQISVIDRCTALPETQCRRANASAQARGGAV